MTSFKIDLADEEARRLEELAERVGMTPEAFLRAGVQAWLASRQKDFADAAAYVLKKNAELYRRLA